MRLHMIENRAKIEKQIYLGRQYVRKALRGLPLSPTQTLPLPSTSHTPDPIANPRISILALDTPQLSSDQPMSVDTDAETAFSRKSHWFFKKGHDYEPLTPTSGSVTPNDRLALDIARPVALRRKRTPEPVIATRNGNIIPSHPAPPSNPILQSKPFSGILLSQLRARSFPNLTSPFSVDPRLSTKDSCDVGEHWSSDSSSEDDLTIEDRRQLRYSSSQSVNLDPLDPNSGDV
ncbi:hypothetical protein C0991_001241 [Blastosporella zonata]|nr:hypothetical protein C0991_001241 [Blastosporella zonata]